MRTVLTVFACCVSLRPLLAQECLTAGHVAAEATVTYMQSCCIGDALLIQSTFVGVDGATIDDFVGLYVTIDNGSVPVWPTSTYLIANGMRFEYWNDSSYYYIQYTPGSVAANYADQPGASIFSLGIDHPSGQPTGDHAVTLRGYGLGCVDPALPPPSMPSPSSPPSPTPSPPPPSHPPVPPPLSPPPTNYVGLRVSVAMLSVVAIIIVMVACMAACQRCTHRARPPEAARLQTEQEALADKQAQPQEEASFEAAPVFRFRL